MSAKPVTPVKPSSMEMVFFYPCPFCAKEQPTIAPLQPTVITCDMCRQSFPIVPVDERTIHFVRIMLAGGLAAVDPDYI